RPRMFVVRGDSVERLAQGGGLRVRKVAAFSGWDDQRLEVKVGDLDLLAVKDGADWKMEKPRKYDADSGKVMELINKVAGLEVKDGAIVDPRAGDLSAYGFQNPAGTVKLTIEEGGDKKKTQEVVFLLGKHESEEKRLYVRVQGKDRINGVDDALLDLAKRSPLTYRNKKLFKF